MDAVITDSGMMGAAGKVGLKTVSVSPTDAYIVFEMRFCLQSSS